MITGTFKQKTKIGVAGSFINQLMGNNSTLPIVGKGATELHYSDRTCYEVIEVSDDFKTVILEYLHPRADKSKELGIGHQEWILEPTGNIITVVWRNNKWKVKGNQIIFTKEFTSKCDNPNKGLYTYLTPKQYEFIYGENCMPTKVVEGITESKTTYSEIKLIFGCKDYHYDWEF